jgi:hypothetical protein
MKYTVHHYLPVIVVVEGVEADSMQDAIRTSLSEAIGFGEENLSTEARHCGRVSRSQFADGHLGALVDEEGDEEFLNTTFFGSEEAANFLPEDGNEVTL